MVIGERKKKIRRKRRSDEKKNFWERKKIQ